MAWSTFVICLGFQAKAVLSQAHDQAGSCRDTGPAPLCLLQDSFHRLSSRWSSLQGGANVFNSITKPAMHDTIPTIKIYPAKKAILPFQKQSEC